MSRSITEETKQEWKDKISSQRESGLSIVSWCKKTNTPIHTFYYWKTKLFPKPPLNRSSFSEIKQQNPKKTLATIKYHGFEVSFDSDIDPVCLKECLKILREVC